MKTCFCHLTIVWRPLVEERLATGINASIHHWKSTFSGLQLRRWQYGSVFIRLAVNASETREMSRNYKRIWPYSSSRSSILVSIESSHATFLLVINSNFGRICYRFKIFALKVRKSLNFPTPTLLWGSAREPFRILWWNLASENWNRGATRWWRNHDANFLHFDTINTGVWQTDGQTDRQTDRHVAVAKTRASIALRG